MALIDERGRLFGRLNIVDAAVGVLLVGLIPLAYLGFVLFRQPEPAILGIEPTKLTPQVARVQITGRNLRPFLRISFNEFQGRTFGMIDAETAEVQIPQLPPGTYDVILYDVAREISRLPGAVTVEGPAVSPTTQARMLVSGRFVGLDDDTAQTIQKGAKLSAVGGNEIEVLARADSSGDRRWFLFSDYTIETPLTAGQQVPALLRTTCALSDRRCQVGGIDIEAGFSLPLFLDSGRPVRFVIADAASDGDSRLVTVRATFIVPEQAAGGVRAGDRARRDVLLGDRVPVLTAVSGPRRRTAKVSMQVPSGYAGGGELAVELDEGALTLDATFQVRVDVTTEGLQYRGRLVRAGAPFVFDHERYVLRGWIGTIDVARESETRD